MKKIVRLTESDLTRIIGRIINEQSSYEKLRPCKPGDEGRLVKGGTTFALSDGSPFCRIEQPTPTTGGGGVSTHPSGGSKISPH